MGQKACCGACDTRASRGEGEVDARDGAPVEKYGDAPTNASKKQEDFMKTPHAADATSGKDDHLQGDTFSSNYFDREASELKAVGGSADKERKTAKHTFRTGARYSGQWLGQRRHGFGVQNWPDGAAFKGQWENDCATGKGQFQHSNGDVYIGQWKNNVAHGDGTYRHQGERTTYEGQFRDDLQDGHGVETWAEGARFEGQFSRGKKHGHGVYLWPDGSLYAGRWAANQIEGAGEYIGKDGRRFAGEWAGSVMHGVGRSTWPDNRSYEGQYAKGPERWFRYIFVDRRPSL